MEKKNFLKSPYFKAAAVLVVLLVVCSAILAILSDLLYVSEAEKTARAIKKIYGKEVGYEDISTDEGLYEGEDAVFNKIYLLDDGNRLYSVTGKKGYSSGTVTLWIVVEYEDEKPVSLGKVALQESSGQTLMSQFGNGFFNKYTKITIEEITEGKNFTTSSDGEDIQNVASGATMSSTAMNNAVNAVLREVFGEVES